MDKKYYPNKNEFCDLYKNMSQLELTKHYKCSKKRIREFIISFKLNLRKKGGGNNRKYKFDKNEIKNLLDSGYKDKEIMSILKINCKSSLYKWYHKFDIKRVKKEYPKYNKYKNKVRYLTNRIYEKYKTELNPKNLKRTKCGVSGGYQLDHIISVFECFYKNISIEECVSKENLQMIRWEDNLKKRIFRIKDNDKELLCRD